MALRRGRLSVAEGLLVRALAVAQKVSATNPEIGPISNGLGELRTRQGRYAEAQAALDRARSLLPPAHPGQAQTLVLLGDLQLAQQRPAAAAAFYRDALAIAQKAHGPRHPDVDEARQRLRRLASHTAAANAGW